MEDAIYVSYHPWLRWQGEFPTRFSEELNSVFSFSHSGELDYDKYSYKIIQASLYFTSFACGRKISVINSDHKNQCLLNSGR